MSQGDFVDFDAPMINKYKDLAALGAEYELRIRLLANKMRLSLSSKVILQDVEKKIIEVFESKLNEEEKVMLAETRELRNKFLHGNFNAVVYLLGKKGVFTKKAMEIGMDSA